MVTMTKQKLENLFNSSKTYAQIGEELSTEQLEITEKMVQAMFKDNGFNLRTRARKSKDAWYTIIDDVTPQQLTTSFTSTPETEEEVETSEEYA